MGVEVLQVLQVCKFAFRFFLFPFFPAFVCVFVFPFSVFVYARANIIMCLSFSSRVLRYKNLLCNISVIQRITKKFQGIRIICLVKVCLLALKVYFCTRNRERCGTSDSVTDLVKQTWEISLIVICTWYLTLAGLRERERIRPREDGWSAFYGSFEKTFSKKLSKTFGGYDKISYLCIRFRKRWQTGIRVL